MRFGKKLALQVMDDQSGAPYLSHKPMKEAINRTVRELRIYQARVQGVEQGHHDGGAADNGMAPAPASPAELGELEERIAALDRQLFALVDEDLSRIHQHVRRGEARLQAKLAAMQCHLMDATLLVGEAQLERLEGVLPAGAEDRSALCRRLIELRMQSDPPSSARELDGMVAEYNALVDVASQHAQYLEINVAGFRKLLKRHEKQIPQKFRSRPMPCLGFHRLVTHTSRQLLELTKQLAAVLADARQRFEEVVSPEEVEHLLRAFGGQWLELAEFKGLGPECEMVLNIQRKLKDPMSSQLMQVTASFSGPGPGCPGFLYPKPGAARPSGSPAQAKGGQPPPAAPASVEPAFMAEFARPGGYPLAQAGVGAHAAPEAMRAGFPGADRQWRGARC
uniref:SPX domain-containing protein n=1 Tax=Zooxanthella nutricula TaxID=1333877 RepID=A0A6U6NI11_9DINO